VVYRVSKGEAKWSLFPVNLQVMSLIRSLNGRTRIDLTCIHEHQCHVPGVFHWLTFVVGVVHPYGR
jgi:hypothetical protein